MTPEQQREVWGMLDRDHLAQVARKGPEPVFATISGAHLYGFASPDSDVDLRGAFLLPASEMLGLHPPAETITIEDKTIIDLDWVAHDIRKFARLMTNHNAYVLEQLFSPLVVLSTPAHQELLELGRGCVAKPTVRHYQGFAKGRRRRLAEPEPTVKHLLYAYRVLLTGVHLMQTSVSYGHARLASQLVVNLCWPGLSAARVPCEVSVLVYITSSSPRLCLAHHLSLVLRGRLSSHPRPIAVPVATNPARRCAEMGQSLWAGNTS